MNMHELEGYFVKSFASAGVIGVIAGALGFLFLWPQSKREGFTRILCSALCSHFFGDAVLRTICNFASWIPPDEIRAGAYLIAALPGWMIFGAFFNYVNKSRDKDIFQIAKDFKKKK